MNRRSAVVGGAEVTYCSTAKLAAIAYCSLMALRCSQGLLQECFWRKCRLCSEVEGRNFSKNKVKKRGNSMKANFCI